MIRNRVVLLLSFMTLASSLGKPITDEFDNENYEAVENENVMSDTDWGFSFTTTVGTDNDSEELPVHTPGKECKTNFKHLPLDKLGEMMHGDRASVYQYVTLKCATQMAKKKRMRGKETLLRQKVKRIVKRIIEEFDIDTKNKALCKVYWFLKCVERGVQLSWLG